MLRADTVIPAGAWSGAPADSVVLDYEERHRRRAVMTGVGGLAFLLDLNEAATLRGGDALKLDDGRVVEVVAAPEPLAEIRAADPRALLRTAWHLGDRRLKTEVMGKALRIRRDPVIEAMAEGLGARVIAVEAPFNPEGVPYVQSQAHGHHLHGHEHGHAHDHDHDGGYHAHHGHEHDHRHHGAGPERHHGRGNEGR
jgi:urease accessory protein